jgi:uncharacterized membrane protein
MTWDDWFLLALKATGVIWLLTQTKKIFALLREAFGRIDNYEIAGMIFTPVLIWMLVEESQRTTENQVFNDFKFGVVAVIVMYGFGLRKIVEMFLHLKGNENKTNNSWANSPRTSARRTYSKSQQGPEQTEGKPSDHRVKSRHLEG